MADIYTYSTPLAELFKEYESAAVPEPSGMVSRPASQKEESTEDAYSPLGFLPNFGATVRSFFTEEEAKEVDALPRVADVRTSAIDEVLTEMDMLAYESAMEASAVREDMGVTGLPGSRAPISSLRPPERVGLLASGPVLNSLRPQARPESEDFEIDTTAIEAAVAKIIGGNADRGEPTPVATEEEPSTRVRQGLGLMSPSAEADPEIDTTPAEPAATEGEGSMSSSLDTKSEKPLSFLKTDTFKLLEGVEGFKSQPYSLNSSATINGKPHRSGLTVGAGIDFGQHTRESLEKIGLPKTMIDKAEKAGWIGLNPDTIIDPKTGKPASSRKRGHSLMYQKFKGQKKKGALPSFTKEELNVATPAMYKPYEDAARRQVDTAFGEGTYDALNEGSKAVLSLEKYHRGEGYTLPDAMIKGAVSGNPFKAADGISWSSRRKNMKDWLKKLEF